jgi:hypothetical protein
LWVSYKTDNGAIPEMIHAIRESTLKGLLEVVYKYVEKFSNLDKNPLCRKNINVKHCHSIMFGSLVLGLQKLQLWPERKSPSEVFSSLRQIKKGLRDITILHYPETNASRSSIQFDHADHSSCLFTDKLKDRVDSVLNNTPTVVQDFHKRHLEAQRSKCTSGGSK